LTFTIAPPPGPALSIHEPVAMPMPWFFFQLYLAPADVFLCDANRFTQRNIAELGHADDFVSGFGYVL
jgi:hypothetical protein